MGAVQLSGAGARDFGVRLLTVRERGPPAFFHEFLLPPGTGFLELRQFDGGIGLRHEFLDANGGEGGDQRGIHPVLCQGLCGAAQVHPSQPKPMIMIPRAPMTPLQNPGFTHGGTCIHDSLCAEKAMCTLMPESIVWIYKEFLMYY